MRHFPWPYWCCTKSPIVTLMCLRCSKHLSLSGMSTRVEKLWEVCCWFWVPHSTECHSGLKRKNHRKNTNYSRRKMNLPRCKLCDWFFWGGVGARQSLEELGCQVWIWLGSIGRCKLYLVDGSCSIFSSSFSKPCSSFFFLNITLIDVLDDPIFSDLYHIWDLLVLQHLRPAIKDLCAEGTGNMATTSPVPFQGQRGEEMKQARHWGLFQ